MLSGVPNISPVSFNAKKVRPKDAYKFIDTANKTAERFILTQKSLDEQKEAALRKSVQNLSFKKIIKSMINCLFDEKKEVKINYDLN